MIEDWYRPIMRNVTGSPVEQDDFFDRPRDLARLQRELANSGLEDLPEKTRRRPLTNRSRRP